MKDIFKFIGLLLSLPAKLLIFIIEILKASEDALDTVNRNLSSYNNIQKTKQFGILIRTVKTQTPIHFDELHKFYGSIIAFSDVVIKFMELAKDRLDMENELTLLAKKIDDETCTLLSSKSFIEIQQYCKKKGLIEYKKPLKVIAFYLKNNPPNLLQAELVESKFDYGSIILATETLNARIAKFESSFNVENHIKAVQTVKRYNSDMSSRKLANSINAPPKCNSETKRKALGSDHTANNRTPAIWDLDTFSERKIATEKVYFFSTYSTAIESLKKLTLEKSGAKLQRYDDNFVVIPNSIRLSPAAVTLLYQLKELNKSLNESSQLSGTKIQTAAEKASDLMRLNVLKFSELKHPIRYTQEQMMAIYKSVKDEHLRCVYEGVHYSKMRLKPIYDSLAQEINTINFFDLVLIVAEYQRTDCS